jgi:hypothetical protein
MRRYVEISMNDRRRDAHTHTHTRKVVMQPSLRPSWSWPRRRAIPFVEELGSGVGCRFMYAFHEKILHAHALNIVLRHVCEGNTYVTESEERVLRCMQFTLNDFHTTQDLFRPLQPFASTQVDNDCRIAWSISPSHFRATF